MHSVNFSKDCDVAKYGEPRYNEIKDEMIHMLTRVGWKKDFVLKSVPVIPISGWMGDNLLTKSEKMASWWKGVDVVVGSNTVHIDTLFDALENMVQLPTRPVVSVFVDVWYIYPCLFISSNF